MKKFDSLCHLTVMLYAVIMRFDSLREIISATQMKCMKLARWGIESLLMRSTLADSNSRCSQEIFRLLYEQLHLTYKDKLSSDIRQTPLMDEETPNHRFYDR